jgi:hypothetical protein
VTFSYLHVDLASALWQLGKRKEARRDKPGIRFSACTFTTTLLPLTGHPMAYGKARETWQGSCTGFWGLLFLRLCLSILQNHHFPLKMLPLSTSLRPLIGSLTLIFAYCICGITLASDRIWNESYERGHVRLCPGQPRRKSPYPSQSSRLSWKCWKMLMLGRNMPPSPVQYIRFHSHVPRLAEYCR